MTFQNRIAAATRRSPIVDDSSPAAQRRWANRKPMQSNGQILFDGVTTPYSCIVRDISSTGAKIEMMRDKFNPDGAAGFLPTCFSLIMPLGRTRVECQSMWRRGSSIGVRFLGAVQRLPTPKRCSMIRRK